ncbi:PaaX family transcriptional regulator [Stackebrandtia nassauensis]|uniref:Transcriptional regulator, PaaX family n=1 Tax=Stackebrandtia nassauensis (strain DSM 44728 / CIP 108903 / NRRL B-16338 / NBRC 102104 / LLR-40K-21) TaxID=446470 RepID=D3Q5L0_STANL|nr:PaaX family transcriptional regulator C-terminal domain-containing protein [Stackebrandtia nassauensis]ADD46070.1 transcriptional regulator, PaaX family [Stackebrandtia nassauensis DSM 44728]
MASSPRSLIVTVFGLYAREAGGTLPVSGLVRVLATLSVDTQAVRAAVSRLKRRGMLEPSKVDGAAGYALTGSGRRLLAEGDARIFHPPRAELSDGWVLCVFSVPETMRAKRHVLRGKLTWLGFGQAAPGVWIAPAHTMDAARAMLAANDLAGYVNLFRSDYCGDAPVAEAARQWWDLPRLEAMYREFIDALRGDPGADQALPAWIRAVTDWRKLPFLDPGLPRELLPADWPGHDAVTLFGELEADLAPAAAAHARRLLGV